MVKNHPDKPFTRYADDAVAHCYTRQGAEFLLASLKLRMTECKLELHPDKTRIVYCHDSNRRGNYSETCFDFLGYTFRPRFSENSHGELFTSFAPAVSSTAKKHMRQTIRGWRMQLKSDKTLEDLSQMFNPIIRGWINYYGRFYKSELYGVLSHFNLALVRWAKRKYKRFRARTERAAQWLSRIARREPKLFKHWEMGIVHTIG